VGCESASSESRTDGWSIITEILHRVARKSDALTILPRERDQDRSIHDSAPDPRDAFVGARLKCASTTPPCQRRQLARLPEQVDGNARAEKAFAWYGFFQCPWEKPKPRRRSQLVTYVINEPCVGTNDSSCVEVCPVDCIHPTPDEDGFAAAEQSRSSGASAPQKQPSLTSSSVAEHRRSCVLPISARSHGRRVRLSPRRALKG
jgi:NAD-dependent dihydropyrimidine dehydrogenase PreA subunit